MIIPNPLYSQMTLPLVVALSSLANGGQFRQGKPMRTFQPNEHHLPQPYSYVYQQIGNSPKQTPSRPTLRSNTKLTQFPAVSNTKTFKRSPITVMYKGEPPKSQPVISRPLPHFKHFPALPNVKNQSEKKQSLKIEATPPSKRHTTQTPLQHQGSGRKMSCTKFA